MNWHLYLKTTQMRREEMVNEAELRRKTNEASYKKTNEKAKKVIYGFGQFLELLSCHSQKSDEQGGVEFKSA